MQCPLGFVEVEVALKMIVVLQKGLIGDENVVEVEIAREVCDHTRAQYVDV